MSVKNLTAKSIFYENSIVGFSTLMIKRCRQICQVFDFKDSFFLFLSVIKKYQKVKDPFMSDKTIYWFFKSHFSIEKETLFCI